jgi:hypothetical protein
MRPRTVRRQTGLDENSYGVALPESASTFIHKGKNKR